jgi:hypothetical protein
LFGDIPLLLSNVESCGSLSPAILGFRVFAQAFYAWIEISSLGTRCLLAISWTSPKNVSGVYRYYCGIIDNYKVWIIDGNTVRQKIYKEFLYGGNEQRYVFNPKGEIWIDNAISCEEYDLTVARYMLQGADLWLNTPRLMQEASGTSGMKAAINGIPHLSVRDGWWEEGYNGRNGWVIGEGVNTIDPDAEDRLDSLSLYDLLEKEVIPLYYDRERDLQRVAEVQKEKDRLVAAEKALPNVVAIAKPPRFFPNNL